MWGDGKVRMRLFARGGDVRNIFGQVLCCEVISGLRWYRSWVRRPGGGNSVLVSYHTNSRFFKSPEEGLDMERGGAEVRSTLARPGRFSACQGQERKLPEAPVVIYDTRINTVAFALEHL